MPNFYKTLCVITVTHHIWFRYRFLSCRPRLDVYSSFGQPLTKQLYKSKSNPHFIKMNCDRLERNFKVYWRNRVAKSSSYTVLFRQRLHERGFKSSRFHALETASKTKRFQSVYTVPISPFSSAYVMAISFPGTHY